MADTLTPYLSLVKPLVGDPEGEDLWGDKLNGNFDLLDQFAAKQGALVEAPQDGKVYGRGTPTNWQEVPLKTDYDDLAVSVGQNSNSIEVLESEMDTKAPLGPDDGAIYGWKDTAWFQLSGSGGFTITWDQITEKPATYPPTLPIPSSGVTGLDAKQSSQDAAIAAINWNSLSGKPPTYPPTLPIPESGVTNLVADLANRPTEAPNDGAQYARQSLTWVKVTGGATIADTAPASPLPNSFWWSSLDGTLYIRYDDGSSAQWCQIVGQQGPAGPAGPTGADSTVPGPQGPAGAQGAPGATGAQGTTGAQGPAGPGVPAGGTTAQVLAKTSNADYATQWVASAPAVGLVDIGDTAPASPVDRQLYWSSTTGKLFIRYNDGNSTAWVQVNAWPSVSGFMPLTGGVFTGPVAIQTANWGTAFSLTATDATGAALLFNRGATPKTRWNMQMDSAAESGSNVGSDFYIWRYNDAGTTNIDAPLRITRSTGQVYMPNVAAGTYSLLGQSCYWSSDAGYTTFMMNTNCYLQYSKVNGNLYWTVNSVAQCVWTYNGTGSHLTITANAYKPGGGVWADSSDARIKNVQGDYELGLDEVIQLRPVRYTFKGNDTPEDPEADKATVAPFVGSPHFGAATDGTGYVGLIAQEVETVFPEMVTQRAAWIDGEQVSDMRDLDTNQLIFALVNAVKTLEARVRELEAVG